MTLRSPAGLWALASLALPLAIHLWRRPPRTVRLGSLRFLQGRPRRLQNLRWREYALLLARLGLLTALALLLARPVWRRPPPTHPVRWVLLDPAAAPSGPSLDRLRALQSAGVETRLLAPGFPPVRTLPTDASAPATPLWSLLREADATLPAGSSLAVFSPGRLASLHGIRPAVAHCRVEWVNTPAAAPTRPPLSTPAPTPFPRTILILHDADRAEDARFVAAAWHAVAETDRLPLTIIVAPTATPTPDAADWIFWLGARPVPPAVTDRAANVLDDARSADANPTPGWIVPWPGAPGTAAAVAPVRLWQRGPPAAGSVLWTDGFGQPLLTRTHDAHGNRWHFASRFASAWNDLPLGPALPATLRALLAAACSEPASGDDRRLADPAQCLPSEAPASPAPAFAPPGTETDLRQPLWLSAVFLFGLERFLSQCRAPRAPASAAIPAAAYPVPSR